VVRFKRSFDEQHWGKVRRIGKSTIHVVQEQDSVCAFGERSEKQTADRFVFLLIYGGIPLHGLTNAIEVDQFSFDISKEKKAQP
jgi:hypothetical protein